MKTTTAGALSAVYVQSGTVERAAWSALGDLYATAIEDGQAYPNHSPEAWPLVTPGGWNLIANTKTFPTLYARITRITGSPSHE